MSFKPLDLEALTHAVEELGSRLPTDLDPLEGAVLSEDLPHRLLDLLEVLGSEGTREAKIVLELLRVILAPDIDLGPGPQALDRVGHDVLGAVTNEVTGLFVLGGEQSKVATSLERQA